MKGAAAVTLSNENGPSRSPAIGIPAAAVAATVRAAYGRQRGRSARPRPLPSDREAS